MYTSLQVDLIPMAAIHLELVMAWRSHPLAYQFFKAQQGPLAWLEHKLFWEKRKNREDYIIRVQEDDVWRLVGSVNISALNTTLPEIGVILGEVTLHGKGVGTQAVRLGLMRLKQLGHKQAKASIHKDNAASQRLFQKLGFKKNTQQKLDIWEEYTLEEIHD